MATICCQPPTINVETARPGQRPGFLPPVNLWVSYRVVTGRRQQDV